MRILLSATAAIALVACSETATEPAEDVAAEADAGESAAPTDIAEDAKGEAADDPQDAPAAEPEPAQDKATPPEDGLERVTISGFECGDNCYLIYQRAGSAEEESALCEARQCDPWFEMQEMPARLVGKKIRVRFGSGQQVDGGGNVMSEDFPAITEIRM